MDPRTPTSSTPLNLRPSFLLSVEHEPTVLSNAPRLPGPVFVFNLGPELSYCVWHGVATVSPRILLSTPPVPPPPWFIFGGPLPASLILVPPSVTHSGILLFSQVSPRACTHLVTLPPPPTTTSILSWACSLLIMWKRDICNVASLYLHLHCAQGSPRAGASEEGRAEGCRRLVGSLWPQPLEETHTPFSSFVSQGFCLGKFNKVFT